MYRQRGQGLLITAELKALSVSRADQHPLIHACLGMAETSNTTTDPSVPPSGSSSNFSERDNSTIPATCSDTDQDHIERESADHSGSTSTCSTVCRAGDVHVKAKFSRKNSLEEMRRMRRERVRGKRNKSKQIKKLE